MTSKTRREARCQILSAPNRSVQKWGDYGWFVDHAGESVDKHLAAWTPDPSAGDRRVGESGPSGRQ